MLFDRLHPLGQEDIIYHYCSASTLIKILENKVIRFTDMNLLNDAEEGFWGYKVFIEAANRLLSREDIPDSIPVIPKAFIEQLDEIWSGMNFGILSFVSCFSTDGDSLSQWRAYADDGRGFAIGFSARALRALPVQMLVVEYDLEKQVKEMIVGIGATYLESLDRSAEEKSWLFERWSAIAASSCAFKNPAWRDEKEVRMQHVVLTEITDKAWKLSSAGGEQAGEPVAGHPIRFLARDSTITAYFDLPFDVTQEATIREIVLGPRCQTGIGNLLFLCGNLGIGVPVIKSAVAKYR